MTPSVAAVAADPGPRSRPPALSDHDDPDDGDGDLDLADAAVTLGVHYMTAYRYVRSGRLPARKVGGVWRVRTADLDAFRAGDTAAGARATDGRDRVERLAERLAADDEPGAMRVVNEHRSPTRPWRLHRELLIPALFATRAGGPGSLRARRADATMLRLLGRLSAAAQAGPTTGLTVLVTAQEHTHDQAAVALVADTFRALGHTVIDLGPHTPADVLADAVSKVAPDLVALVVADDEPGPDADWPDTDRPEIDRPEMNGATVCRLGLRDLIPQADGSSRYDSPRPISVHGGQEPALDRLLAPLTGEGEPS